MYFRFIELHGLITTTGNLNLSGNAISLGGSPAAVSSTPGNIILTHTGTLTMTAGTVTTGGSFTESGGGTVSLGTTVASTGPMSFSSPILLSATSQLTGTASATFNNTINGAFNLGITSTGAVTFNSGANIGAVAAPTSLNVTGVSISVGANQKANPAILGQVMSYTGPVTITAPVAFTDVGLNALIFSSTITGNFPLTLNPHSRPFPLGAL